MSGYYRWLSQQQQKRGEIRRVNADDGAPTRLVAWRELDLTNVQVGRVALDFSAGDFNWEAPLNKKFHATSFLNAIKIGLGAVWL